MIKGTTEIASTFGRAVSHDPGEFWQRKAPDSEIMDHFGDEIFEEDSSIHWYARRYKTMVLIMNRVWYMYKNDSERYGDAEVEIKAKVQAFDDFFHNKVDTDAFWE